MKSLFGGKKEARCATCLFCAYSSCEDKLLCEKKGLVPRDGHCHRYRYDPFKRVPEKAPELPAMSEEDFSL